MDKLKTEKQIQIPQALFVDLMAYFMLDKVELEESIKKGLETKLEALVKRDLYTKYKTGPTEEQREKARKEYLDKIGVPDSFRW